MTDDVPIRCSRDGRFVKTHAFLSEGSVEMIRCRCSCGATWTESY